MNKEIINGGGAAIGVGVILWIVGRFLGGVAVFAPLVAVIGVLMVVCGLFMRKD